MANIGEQVKSVVDALSPLAQKLGEGAEHVYHIYVRQAIATGVAELFMAVVLSIVGIVGSRLIYKNWETICDNDMEPLVIVLGIFMGAGILIALPILYSDGLMHLISPEYYAIQDLLTSIK